MKYGITIRFYEELNDFLPRDRRKQDIDHAFDGRRSVKDLIESLGVPHVEVDLILVNGVSANFDYIVADGDRISVYPVFETLSIKGITRLRPRPLRVTRFILDVHLRKLARRLRLLGFDTYYNPALDDPGLAELSARESRVLLTRDRGLLMRRVLTRGLLVRNTDPEKQAVEILDRMHLKNDCRPFTRCIECNGLVEDIPEEAIALPSIRNLIPPEVLEWCDSFHRCASCGKIYWKGSHYTKLAAIAENILKAVT